MSGGLEQSVQARLVRHAHALGVDCNFVLARYAAERLLYRLSRSPECERFVLKGALLLLAWLGEGLRPTRDADLLAREPMDADGLARLFVALCGAPVEPDGLRFDPGSIRVEPIRADIPHGGLRISLLAFLGPARLRVQVDVGFGDLPVPEPAWLEYPGPLDQPRARLLAYHPGTAVAEKVHAMVTLGSRNSRMRDFFDVHAFATRLAFDGGELAAALAATFSQRRTPFPAETPIALTAEFAGVEGKQAQWAGFLRRSGLAQGRSDLGGVIAVNAAFIGPVLVGVASGEGFRGAWPAGGPWRG